MKKNRVIATTLLVMGSFISIFPFWWLIRSSLMSNTEIFTFPPKFLPKKWLISNYVEALNVLPYLTYLKNTLTIMVPVLIGTLFTASLCAFGFARLNFRTKNFWFTLVIASMIMPTAVTLIPIFLMWRNLGFYNSFAPLIIPSWFGGGAFNIFMLRQFFLTIPRELDEAAVIDGASYFQIYYKIMIPLIKPALIAVGIFTFLNVWNDFFGPLIYISSDSKFTIALGLMQYVGQFSTKWNLLMAASAITIIPIIILYFIGQKYFVEGIALSGIKG